MNLSEIQLSLLNKNFQNLLQLLHKILTLEKLLLSQRGQTMKLLSVKKKQTLFLYSKTKNSLCFPKPEQGYSRRVLRGVPSSLLLPLAKLGRERRPLGGAPTMSRGDCGSRRRSKDVLKKQSHLVMPILVDWHTDHDTAIFLSLLINC